MGRRKRRRRATDCLRVTHRLGSGAAVQTLVFFRAGRRCLDQLSTAGPLGLVEARVAFEVTEQEEEVEEEEELQQAYRALPSERGAGGEEWF